MEELIPSGYRLQSIQWGYAAAVLIAVVLLPAIWGVLRRPFGGLGWLALLMRSLAVVALAFCLLEPMRRVERPLPGANVMALLVDGSRSMQIKPTGESLSRMERVRPSLATQSAWQARLGQDFDVRRYAFDSTLRSVEDLAEMEAGGNLSSLALAVGTIGERFATRPVAGVILFSDGVSTDSLDELLDGPDLPFPIYPVVDDSERELKDISLTDSSVTVSSFELAPASVEATVRALGFAGRDVIVRLMDAAGETLEAQTLKVETSDWEKKVRFRFRPSEPGTQFVSLRVMLASEDNNEKELASAAEVTVANNVQLLAVTRGGGPFKLLYVSGRPNWEFKFIRRALDEDVELDLHALVRIAKEEPKFSFGDKTIAEVNPLIAGFSQDEETAEQYDEPVFLRLGVGEGELKTGFPSGEEDLFAYQAIVLDDVDASFFTQQQMMLIREFVSVRGGGLMMLGGTESFVQGGFEDTPLGDVLPVYLNGRRLASSDSATKLPVLYEPTRDGALQPWLRLRANEAGERQRLAEMPQFEVWNAVGAVKPGASTFVELATPDGLVPGLVGQRFGRGRSLALMIGDFWRWGIDRKDLKENDLAQTWRQVARWLTNDAPLRVEVEIEKPASMGGPSRILVQVRDEAFKPADNAQVSVRVVEPDATQIVLAAKPDAVRAGEYSVDYWSGKDGGYLCTVEVETAQGEHLPPRVAGWTAQPSAAEFARVTEDRTTLKRLAERSGGQLVASRDLESFAGSLPSRKVPVSEIRWEPLWHRPWLLLFAVACLCLEWGMRRWKGLP